jgi:spermidine synthase/MFS family permease
MLPLLYALFVVSGAAGLMYESIWSRYLGLFVGHGAYAQILVLVIFLGGMSIGAHLVGRRSERLREPLLWYAAVELAVAVIGVAFHAVFGGVTDAAYDGLFPRLPAGVVLLTVKWTIAALLILPQSVLLGATFPLMSAGALRRAPGQPGRTLSLLYFANSLGAAGGVLLAGFVLLAAAGLPGTLLVAAGCNTLVAMVAWLVTRVDPEVAPAAGAGAGTGHSPDASVAELPAGADERVIRERTPGERLTRLAGGAPRPLVRALLLVAFGTAAASFVYEVAWIRMLSLVVGSATHSFELMLSAFILGLALGAWWIRGRADRLADPVRTLGLVQWIMGSLAIATLPIYVFTFDAMAALLGAIEFNAAGYTVFTVVRYLFCLAVMLPATFCAGVTLPLITRILIGHGAGERAIGQVYAVNTLGSILGAAMAGLVLMPLLGLKWLLVVGALIDVALGLWLLARHGSFSASEAPPRAARPAARRGAGRARAAWTDRTARAGQGALLPTAVVGVGVLLLVATLTPFHAAVLSSGVYRYARVSDPRGYDVPFYRDGRTATVSVRRAHGTRMLTLATNGKPDASLSLDWINPPARDSALRRPLTGDQVTQALLPLVTMAHAPRARTAAVIGQGSGMTSHLLLGSPALRRLATIDIEPEMIRGSRVFYPANRRVFDDPRATFVVDDAKAFFASARRSFDVIVSEPSNPWVSGVSGLFTDEFYARVRGYLAPGGVFGQWLHLYEIDDHLVLTVLSALHRNFPSYQIYMVSTADLFVVASNEPQLPTPDWGVVAFPARAARLRALAAARLGDPGQPARARPCRAGAGARRVEGRELGLSPTARSGGGAHALPQGGGERLPRAAHGSVRRGRGAARMAGGLRRRAHLAARDAAAGRPRARRRRARGVAGVRTRGKPTHRRRGALPPPARRRDRLGARRDLPTRRLRVDHRQRAAAGRLAPVRGARVRHRGRAARRHGRRGRFGVLRASVRVPRRRARAGRGAGGDRLLPRAGGPRLRAGGGCGGGARGGDGPQRSLGPPRGAARRRRGVRDPAGRRAARDAPVRGHGARDRALARRPPIGAADRVDRAGGRRRLVGGGPDALTAPGQRAFAPRRRLLSWREPATPGAPR